MKKGRILGIDYGAKSIGLAVSDVDRQMAFGRGVLVGKKTDQIFAFLGDFLQEEDVRLIILGLPLAADGSETKQTERIRGFADQLKEFLEMQHLEIPIDFIDESFSSFEANAELREIGVPGKDRKKTEDEMAAIILVQRFIDFRP